MTRPARKDGKPAAKPATKAATKPAAKPAKAKANTPATKPAAKPANKPTAKTPGKPVLVKPAPAKPAPASPAPAPLRPAPAPAPVAADGTGRAKRVPRAIEPRRITPKVIEPPVATPLEPIIDATESPMTEAPMASPGEHPRPRPEQGFQPRRAEHPRRVHHGIRLRRKAAMDGFPWWAQAWFKGMEGGFGEAVRTEGLQYAQSGQVVTMELLPGTARMKVQGRATRPYECSMTFHPWTSEQWTAVVAAMSQEAIHSARLLTGELPQGAERLVSGLGLRLFPAGLKAADPIVECACKEAKPCKHVHAAACVLAERIEVDPLVLFTLRGLTGERLLERIQEHRALTSRGVQSAHNPPPIAQQPPELAPLSSLMHDFWRPGRALTELDDAVAPQHIPHALLRRLGPSSLGGRFRLVGLLASAYDTIRQRAITPPQDGSTPSA